MDTVITDKENIIIKRRPIYITASSPVAEASLVMPETTASASRRFGIADLWKIHRSKKYVGAYSRLI